MNSGIESTLYIDPQTVKTKPCPVCGGATYPPGYHCIRCEKRDFATLEELSGQYRASAEALSRRLKLLRELEKQAEDPEEIWHIHRRIAELTPMLTQMNELAQLTAHYYERGYYRGKKYSL